jgi:predicted lipoprotein with Yx(FWY)xxD motif
MKNNHRSLLAVMLISAILLAACASSAEGGGVPPSQGSTAQPTQQSAAGQPGAQVSSASNALGQILTDAQGMTLYATKNDSSGQPTCTGNCAQLWPPFATNGQPEAGAGVDLGLLGTVTRDDGSTQVTYNGMPLYLYSGDKAPGDTNGQGIGGVWYVVSADGTMVQQGSSGPTATPAGAAGNGTGYSY